MFINKDFFFPLSTCTVNTEVNIQFQIYCKTKQVVNTASVGLHLYLSCFSRGQGNVPCPEINWNVPRGFLT